MTSRRCKRRFASPFLASWGGAPAAGVPCPFATRLLHRNGHCAPDAPRGFQARRRAGVTPAAPEAPQPQRPRSPPLAPPSHAGLQPRLYPPSYLLVFLLSHSTYHHLLYCLNRLFLNFIIYLLRECNFRKDSDLVNQISRIVPCAQ